MIATLLFPVLVSLSPSSVIGATGRWVALDRAGQCDAVSRPVSARGDAFAGFTFPRGRFAWGAFAARLAQPARPGSSVIVEIGAQSFLLDASAGWARSRDAAQAEGMRAALRGAERLRVRYVTASGQRTSDYYPLTGAPTALDAAAARCASTGQSG